MSLKKEGLEMKSMKKQKAKKEKFEIQQNVKDNDDNKDIL